MKRQGSAVRVVVVALAFLPLLAAGCSGVLADPRAPFETPATRPPASAERIVLGSGDTLQVARGVAVLRGPGGQTLAENARVVRGRDPGGVCPAEGFRAAEPVGKGFVLRNQLCSGWFFIDEVMTFAPSGDGYRLVRFSASYLDRGTGEPDGSPRVLSESRLGDRRFGDLDPDELYKLLD